MIAASWYFPAGLLAGALYFGCVWWNARLFAAGGSARMTLWLMLGRLAIMAALLVLAARQGALPLLATAGGVFAARFAVMRGLRGVAP